MGQIKTRCSAAAGLFLILLTVIAGFSSCKSNQKDIIPSAEYAPYVNAYTGGVISQNSTIQHRADTGPADGRPESGTERQSVQLLSFIERKNVLGQQQYH